ncbi:uncharacterized protein [Ptychodera flava]|uniref:uncharacterized protein n=1 Tax=Ptychodera flava TaxID=63121 RepID=UPI00396A120F
MKETSGRTIHLIVFAFIVRETVGDWTNWYNLHDDKSGGDVEKIEDIREFYPNQLCDNPTAMDAVTVDGDSVRSTRDVFRQFNATGLECVDEDQINRKCNDYKVRFCCPGSHGALTCKSEDVLNQYPVTAISSINIPEDTGVGIPIFNLSEFSSDGYLTDFSSAQIVYGNTFNRFSVSEDDNQILVAAFLTINVTSYFNLTIHIEMTDGYVKAFGLAIRVDDVISWPPYYNTTCETKPSTKSWPFALDLNLRGGWLSDLHLHKPKHNFTYVDMTNCKCSIDGYILTVTEKYGYMLKDLVIKATDRVSGHVEKISIGSVSERFQVMLHGLEWNHPIVRRWIRALSHMKNEQDYEDFVSNHVIVQVELRGIDPNKDWNYEFSIVEPVENPPIAYNSLELAVVGCPSGKYGISCDMKCICKNGATCHVWNGACKCAVGWQGPACDIPVPPHVTLSVEKDIVPVRGTIRFVCRFINIRREDLKIEFNGILLYNDFDNGPRERVNLFYVVQRMALVSISNATKGDAGTYRCAGNGHDDKKLYFSNTVIVDVKGCKDNVWGKNCTKICDCIHAHNCIQFEGCQCVGGWAGDKCDRDVQKPIIHDCPSNITIMARHSADEANVTWQSIKATDNEGISEMISTHESGQVFPVGNSKVVISVFDHQNNSAICSFTVTVNSYIKSGQLFSSCCHRLWLYFSAGYNSCCDKSQNIASHAPIFSPGTKGK